MLIPNGQLGKLRIIAFGEAEMLPNSLVGQIETLINPEGYSKEYGIEYNKEQAEGSSESEGKYVKTSPESMEFRFIFDRTGVMPGSPPIPGGVVADIEEFKRLTYEFNSDTHRSNFLRIIWGALIFPCILEKMNIQYKLFKSDGTPIRAEITANFKKFVDNKLRAKIENKLSPDLTRKILVKEGDTLPLLAHRIYGNAIHYLELARINGLVNFKVLQPGQQLLFPPIEK